MKTSAKVLLGAVLVLGGFGTAFALKTKKGDDKDAKDHSVLVERGSLVDKALAVGTIEPEIEVTVKSKVSGVVGRRFANVGDFVQSGAPLLEIRPDPTPLELADARRQVELREIELDNRKKELARQQSLKDQGMLSAQAFELSERAFAESALQTQMARERLALIEKGKVTIANSKIESIITSPISGFILEKKVEVGDPVTALSTYQEGTVLMTMADMKHLIFRGTVDEIDVGRLKEGMSVQIKIGALPNAKITGSLRKIWLKARKEENATTFPVEIALTSTEGATLRAGFSANAEIIIQRRDSVITIPERVVTFKADTASVNVLNADGTQTKRTIKTGLSDAINIEVIAGLKPGEKVAEKPVQDVK